MKMRPCCFLAVLLSLLIGLEHSVATDLNGCYNQVATHCRSQTLLFGIGAISGQVNFLIRVIEAAMLL